VAAGARGAGRGRRPRPRRVNVALVAGTARRSDRLPQDRPPLPAGPGAARDLPERRRRDAEQPPAAAAAELYRRCARRWWLVGARERGSGRSRSSSARRPLERAAGLRAMFADLRTLRDEVRADGTRFGILVFLSGSRRAPGHRLARPGHDRRFLQTRGDTAAGPASGAGAARRDWVPRLRPPEPGGGVRGRVLESSLLPPEGGRRKTPPRGQPRSFRQARAALTCVLCARLKDPDAERRAAARAVDTLGGSGPARGRPDERARRPMPAVRAAVAWALGRRAGGRSGLAGPLPAQDGDPLVRAGAAHALGGIGSAATPPSPVFIARLCRRSARALAWRMRSQLARGGTRSTRSRSWYATAGPDGAWAAGRSDVWGPGADRVRRSWSPPFRPAARRALARGLGARSDRTRGDAGRARTARRSRTWSCAGAAGRSADRPRRGRCSAGLIRLLDDPSSSVRWRVATAPGAIGARRRHPPLAAAAPTVPKTCGSRR
jgi:hypothetical protein